MTEGQLLIDRLKGIDIILERDGDLLLHLFGRGSRIEGHHQSLPHHELGKLILVHLR